MDSHQEIQNLLFSLLFELKSSLAKSLKGNRFDLAPMHHKALAYVHNFPDATQQEMVDKTGRDKAQITRLLNELEKKGLIRRKKDDADKRVFRIRLTDKGADAFRELRQYEDALTSSLLEGFSEKELEGLKQSLNRMRSNLILGLK